MHFNFDLDLEDGKEGEEFVRQLLTGKFTIEVKRDFIAKNTGNVFIETHQYGRPSGINTSQAEYWAFVLERRVFIVPTDELRTMLPFGIKIAGGDDKEFDGVLLSKVRLMAQR